MAVTDSQKVDLLYKKLFGVAKTDLPANKSPSNESIASPALLRGDNLWTEASQIPTAAAAVPNIVQAYQTTSRVECTADTTTTPIGGIYPTWKTNLTDWIPSEFGATYFVKVYVDTTGAANPVSTGTQIFDSGSGGTGEWFFDYQAGVLNFIGGTIPASLVAGKSIFVTGYRYIGRKSSNFSNIVISGGTVSNLTAIGATTTYFTNLNASSGNIVGPLYASSISTPNLAVTGTISGTVSTANIALFENITNTTATGVFFPSFYDTSSTGNAKVYVSTNLNFEPSAGNLTTTNIKANVSITSNVALVDYIVPQDLNAVQFPGDAAIRIPSGNTAQRPAVATTGYFRYNVELAKLEFYDGDEWVPVDLNAPSIGSQGFYADGVSTSFALNGPGETAQSLLVSVNGTTQVPDVAYTVAANVITFGEVLNSTDFVDIRYLSIGTTPGGNIDGAVNIRSNISSTSSTTGALTVEGGVGIAGNVNVGNTAIINVTTNSITSSANVSIDSFTATQYRTAKYTIQVVDVGTTPNKVHVTEAMVFHDNNGASTIPYLIEYGTGYNTGSLGNLNVAYSSGLVSLIFKPNYTPTNMTVKVLRHSITS